MRNQMKQRNKIMQFTMASSKNQQHFQSNAWISTSMLFTKMRFCWTWNLFDASSLFFNFIILIDLIENQKFHHRTPENIFNQLCTAQWHNQGSGIEGTPKLLQADTSSSNKWLEGGMVSSLNRAWNRASAKILRVILD